MMRFALLGVVIGCTTGVLVGCSGQNQEAARKEVAGPARLIDVARLTGILEPVVQVELRSEVAGRLESILAVEGDTLKRGQTVAVIDAERMRHQEARLAILVQQAELRLEQTRRAWERGKALHPTGALSDDAIADLGHAVRQAELDLKSARFERSAVQTDLARTRISSPIEGVLISLDVEEGELLASATQGLSGKTLVGVVADLTRMQVRVDVGELDWPRLRAGQKVSLRSEASPGLPISGKVRFLGRSARSSTASGDLRVFPMEIEFEPGHRALAPGMTVDAEVVLLEREALVTLPLEAVSRSNGRATVLRPTRGDADAPPDTVEVRTGDTDFRRIEILEGLAAGDTVLVPETPAKPGRRGPS